MKELILVTSPPACGKTFISKELAKHLKHVVYLDKDTLIVLSKQIFVVANEEYNRSSDFFEKYIRDYEYYAVVDLALEALDYEDIVLINAPFTREIRDKKYIADLKARLAEKGAVASAEDFIFRIGKGKSKSARFFDRKLLIEGEYGAADYR